MRIGIDLGGTKIEGIALDSKGNELARLRIPTPKGDYQGTLKAIESVVTELETRTGRTGSVGMGIPGTISPATGLIKNSNSTSLIGHPMSEDLTTLLKRPVRLSNDANCFAVSEATDGSGTGFDLVFGVIVGTGVGGGLVFKGEVHSGINGISGEWGHINMPWMSAEESPGPDCYCGKNGCVETFLSGPGMENDYRTLGGDKDHKAQDIVELASNGDARANETLDRYENRLARGLATIITLIDPDVIILGGGISNIDRIYENVPKIWQYWAFSDRTDTPLLQNTHGDSSGVRGAAWLWPQERP